MEYWGERASSGLTFSQFCRGKVVGRDTQLQVRDSDFSSLVHDSGRGEICSLRDENGFVYNGSGSEEIYR